MPYNYLDNIPDNADEFYGTRIQPVPAPKPDIGIDTENQIIYDFDSVESSRIDTASINSLTSVSRRRDELYYTFDSMAEDTTLAAALEIYAEDVTEKNENGRIVWAESDDPDIQKYVMFLLDSFNVDKNIYSWTYCLCKYGDVYLKLFKEEDTEDPIFKSKDKKKLNEGLFEESVVNESIRVFVPGDNEKFAFYAEMVPNPAVMFELSRLGKTAGYIETPLNILQPGYQSQDSTFLYSNQIFQKYNFNQQDVNIYPANFYVHACLEDGGNRYPEQVNLIISDPKDYFDEEHVIDPKTGGKNSKSYSSSSNSLSTASVNYSVRRGQSVLYDVFKTWRQLTLLENSVLLNRLTKSSITRIINVEVGDMPKEKVQDVVHRVKQVIEQKSAINAANSMSDYTNAGPYENSVYMPSYNGKGQITTTIIGGDVDINVNGLADIEYFKNKMHSGLKIPKQFLSDTDDSTGFNGGTALSIISSRYAKTVIRIQAAICQMLTDLINIILLDRGFLNRVNKFKLKMTPPTTQEQLDRQEQRSSQIALIRDTMDLVSDIDDPIKKLKILKSLLSGLAMESDIIAVIQEEIDKLEEGINNEEEPVGGFDDSEDINLDIDVDDSGDSFNDEYVKTNPIQDLVSDTTDQQTNQDTSAETSGETVDLPNMADLGIDFTDNT